jgi:hypothetical protein
MVGWINGFSFDRVLVDLSTGAANYKGGVLSAVISDNQLKALRGQAFVALMPTTVSVVDDNWLPVFGPMLRIPGGCELAVDGDRLALLEARVEEGLEEFSEVTMVPLTVRDPVYPRVAVAVPYRNRHVCFNLAEAGMGPRVIHHVKRCVHPAQDPPQLCDYCFRRWWQGKVKWVK